MRSLGDRLFLVLAFSLASVAFAQPTFTEGQFVTALVRLNVRSEADALSPSLGVQEPGSIAVVVSGIPIRTGGYEWWLLSWIGGPTGYSASGDANEAYLGPNGARPPLPEETQGKYRERVAFAARLFNEPVDELRMLTSEGGGPYSDDRWTHGIELSTGDDTWLAAWFETRDSRRIYLLHLPTGVYCQWVAVPFMHRVEESEWMLTTKYLGTGIGAVVSVRMGSSGVRPHYAITTDGRCIVQGNLPQLH